MARAGLLGELEQVIMLAVLRLEDGAYAVAILDEVESRTGVELSRGSVYVTLDRLEQKLLLESRFADPTPERGGKAKRYFRVTALGKEALRRSHTVLTAMWSGQETVLEEP